MGAQIWAEVGEVMVRDLPMDRLCRTRTGTSWVLCDIVFTNIQIHRRSVEPDTSSQQFKDAKEAFLSPGMPVQGPGKHQNVAQHIILRHPSYLCFLFLLKLFLVTNIYVKYRQSDTPWSVQCNIGQ